jgi:hypothetical protein
MSAQCNEPRYSKVKVKFTIPKAIKAQREIQVQLYSFFNLNSNIPTAVIKERVEL